MADIFISYSSKDREKAEQLTELLTSAGLSVWIDESGIDLATSWSGEIVDAIENCKAFLVLLSPNSVASANVIKEVTLAAEQKKKILPVDLEPVELPRDLKYHLAGLQRAPVANIGSIIRALGKLGLKATKSPQHTTVKPSSGTALAAGQSVPESRKVRPAADTRKSLMILPFEDLSPTADNQWFANGIVSELITALSHVKSLKVTDAERTKEYRSYKGNLTVYAREMGIRYFVQGDVRKFGEQIKITARLLDIETGDHLWQDVLKGTMGDIFDIQEKVAEKVVEGLKLHLGADEKLKLTERGTENAEAYELSLKAYEYFQRNTKDGFQLAAQLYSEAIALDAGYAQAYSAKANALGALYRNYDRDPQLLEEGLLLLRQAQHLKPDLWIVNHPLSQILMLQGKLAEAEHAAKEYVNYAPQDWKSHSALGFFYFETGQYAQAIAPFEESLELKPDELSVLFNLTVSSNAAKDLQKQTYWAEIAIPRMEKHRKLFADDEHKRVEHALLLHYAGRTEEAKAAARKLDDLHDGGPIYNAACLLCALKEYDRGIMTFRKAIVAGFRNMRILRLFLEDEDDGIGTLKGTPEWEEVRQLVEQIDQEAEAKKRG